jgi:hypothetical protein
MKTKKIILTSSLLLLTSYFAPAATVEADDTDDVVDPSGDTADVSIVADLERGVGHAADLCQP